MSFGCWKLIPPQRRTLSAYYADESKWFYIAIIQICVKSKSITWSFLFISIMYISTIYISTSIQYKIPDIWIYPLSPRHLPINLSNLTAIMNFVAAASAHFQEHAYSYWILFMNQTYINWGWYIVTCITHAQYTMMYIITLLYISFNITTHCFKDCSNHPKLLTKKMCLKPITSRNEFCQSTSGCSTWSCRSPSSQRSWRPENGEKSPISSHFPVVSLIVTQKLHHHGRIVLEFHLNIMNWYEIGLFWHCFRGFGSSKVELL